MAIKWNLYITLEWLKTNVYIKANWISIMKNNDGTFKWNCTLYLYDFDTMNEIWFKSFSFDYDINSVNVYEFIYNKLKTNPNIINPIDC